MEDNKYYEQIKSEDWDAIVAKAKANPQKNDGGNLCGYEYLGSCLAMFPSGKYYMPWACSNVTEEEAAEDEEYREALEAVAEENGGWIAAGEGDPCDVFFVISLEEE